MNNEELLKELEFDKETLQEDWTKCAICGNKADFARHIRLNEHCNKCYNYHNRKVQGDKMDRAEARKFYKELLENGISEKEYKIIPRWIK